MFNEHNSDYPISKTPVKRNLWQKHPGLSGVLMYENRWLTTPHSHRAKDYRKHNQWTTCRLLLDLWLPLDKVQVITLDLQISWDAAFGATTMQDGLVCLHETKRQRNIYPRIATKIISRALRKKSPWSLLRSKMWTSLHRSQDTLPQKENHKLTHVKNSGDKRSGSTSGTNGSK